MPRWHARGAIEFDRVCFAYEPGQPVLRDVSMTIEPGSTVAIVGPSGSGKSTLASLLLKLYEPTAGEIRIGGFPLAMIAESQFRGQIGLVPQDPVVFRATLADNIRYAAPRATDDEVLRSAHAALLAPLLQKLPTGLATLVGEGGHPLSQGERQRIAIARLLCQDPAIVVLDEATSALDQDCEAHVQEALARLLAGRTTIVIAHRLATIERADAIVVMDQGQIVQQGTHEQLLADRSGLYFQLYTSQFARQAARARARHPGHLQPAQTTYEPVPA